jgi:site-specific DNA-methyltransferase (adenine-specific)
VANDRATEAGGGAGLRPYYNDGKVVIYHGDCAVIAPALGAFDLLVTDPPYGLGEARGKQRHRRTQGGKWANRNPGGEIRRRDYGTSTWDDSPPSQALLDALRAQARWQCIFGGNYFALPPQPGWLVWDKDNGASDFADCELAWTNYGCAVRRKRHRWAGMLQEDMANKEERYHPTQKPIPVMSWAIGLCPVRPSSAFDPFMGSGTTLRVCKDLGIAAVGIDADERCCETAAKRLAQSVLW